ncbi:unnamed protein product [Paramecium sonneborni]|uniref:Uncharacterized protein n=1 Tax=Paramecium sonneborni TaxID=65129 RepID=A0A8S1RN56_9CILI|nr:unnamed protein product [Paramecium sonneborni]
MFILQISQKDYQFYLQKRGQFDNNMGDEQEQLMELHIKIK